MADRCGRVLISSPIDGQLTCCRQADHKGAHRLSREDERRSSEFTARWVRRALSRSRGRA